MLGLALVGSVLLFALGFAAVVNIVQGETAGGLVTSIVAQIGLRGTIEVKSINWPARILWDVVTDNPTPLVIEGVTITDPDGVVVLRAPRLELKVPPRSALSARIKMYDLKIGPDVFWRFADTKDGKNNGFLSAVAPKPKIRPEGSEPPPEAEPSDFLIQIVNADLDGFTAEFDYPGAWGLLLSDIKGTATLRVEGDFVGFDCQNVDARKGGHLTILTETLPFDRVKVKRVATTPEWRNDIFLEIDHADTGKSILTGKGFFTHIYDGGPAGIDLHAEFANAANALDSVHGPILDSVGDLEITGDDARIVLDLTEPFERIAINGTLAGLDIRRETMHAKDTTFDLHFVAQPLEVSTRSFRFNAPDKGQLELGARLWADATRDDDHNQEPDLVLKSTVAFKNLSTRTYVPKAQQAMAAGSIDGNLDAEFNLATTAGRIRIPRLDIRRARAAGLPRRIGIDGQASFSPTAVETTGIHVRVPGATAQAKGKIDLVKQSMALSLRTAAHNLGQALAPFGVPNVAHSAQANVQVSGAFDNPSVSGSAKIQKVGVAGGPIFPEIRTAFSLHNGLATLKSLHGEILGGSIDASGSAKLYRNTVAKMLKTPSVEIKVSGKTIELGSLLADAIVTGALSFEASAAGPVNKINGKLDLPRGTQLTVLGEAFTLDGLSVEVTPTAITLRPMQLNRKNGGRLMLEGSLGLAGNMPLAMHLRIDDFPLAGAPGVAASGMDVQGTLSADLKVGGTIATPLLEGTLAFDDVAVDTIALGDAQLAFETRADGTIATTGKLFALATVEAQAKLFPAGPHADVVLAFNALKIEEILARMGKPVELQSRLTGTVNLAIRPGKDPSATVRLTEVWVALSEQLAAATGAAETPLSIKNRGDIVAHWSGDTTSLETTTLVTEAGEFQFDGKLKGDDVIANFVGQLDAEFLQPFLDKQFTGVQGSVMMGLKAEGKLSQPALTGTIAITRPIRMDSKKLGMHFEVPTGMINVRPGTISLHNLSLQVDESAIVLQGNADHDPNFALTRFSVEADGELSARLLSVLAPTVFTESRGTLTIKGRLDGTPAAPDFDALIKANAVNIRLRAFDRPIEVQTAELRLNTREMELTNVRLVLDNQGVITIGTPGTPLGRVVFEQLAPEFKIRYASLPIRGEHLNYRSPGVFEVDDLGFQLQFEGDFDKNMALAGDVRVISGRVTWDFDVKELAIKPRIVEGYGRPAPPNPLLDQMTLDLTVRTIGDTFFVQNNLAPEMYMWIDVNVGGTVGRPLISGNLRPTDGRFHILGLRGDFDLVPDVNFITFEPTRSLEDLETPWIDIKAENLVTDNNGSEHLVRMRISGPVGQARIEFSSDTGLNQNQALLLLLSGQPSLSPARFGTGNPTLGRNLNTGVDIAGQATRDVMSSLIEPYIADTLALLTGDRLALRPTVGSDGLEMRLFGRFSRQLRLQMSYLRGFQNQQRARGEAALWLADYVNLRSFGEYLQFQPQPGINETFSSVNLELSLEYPLRLPWP
jgi:autotransporter translocation and assembly factor TamB